MNRTCVLFEMLVLLFVVTCSAGSANLARSYSLQTWLCYCILILSQRHLEAQEVR